jgi:DHA2 family multidrug resistance protein-like MFS transporter
MLTQVGGANGLAIVVGASVVISLALAPVYSLTTELIVGSAPPERAGAASGISETGSELGGALGISILGSVGTAIYRGEVAGAMPAGVPADAAQGALDTLGAAPEVAQQLPEPIRAAFLSVVREAFVQSIVVTAIASAIIAVGVAIMAVILLRTVEARSEPEGQYGPEAGEAPAVNLDEPEADSAA